MKYLFLILIGCWVIAGTFITQHTAWTEMLVYPYLLNHGFILYKDLIAPYTPLFLWLLQNITSIFGYTPQVSLWMTLVLAFINTVLVYLVSQSLWKNKHLGIISAAFYALWFFYFEGNGLWFELFQTPLIIGSFYFLYRYFFQKEEYQNLWLGSILLATTFFIKQSVLWVILGVGLWLLINKWKSPIKLIKSVLILSVPLLLLLIVTSLIIWHGGALTDYLQWAFVYTFLQFPISAGHSNYPTVSQLLKFGIPLLSLVPVLFVAIKWKKEAIFSLFILAATFMASLPRWGLFHLQPFLAIMAIVFIPFAFQWIKNGKAWKKVVTVCVVLVWVIVVGRQMERFWNMPIRFFEPLIYQEAVDIKSKGYQDFFAFNFSDQLYLLTGTVPKVKPYVQNFAWYMEMPGMQDMVIRSLEQEITQYIVFSPFSGKSGYNIGDYRPKVLGDYINNSYRLKEKLTEQTWVLERIK